MRAVVCQNTELSVMDLPDPVPAKGQVLVEVERCGICGSDLHLRHACDSMKDLLGRVGAGDLVPASTDRLVFGHEFCATVLDHGPRTRRRLKPGTRVVAQPMLRVGDAVHLCGLSPVATGGYAERMLLQESMLLPVPNGLSSELAALTEPMSVGLHAVRRSEIAKRDLAVVIGCGPVGLAVICLLKAQGVATVVASDFSPGRRELARRCGADVVIDPAKDNPYADRDRYRFFHELPDLVKLAADTQENLSKLPVPWHMVWRTVETLGVGMPQRPVIFECVGVPGVVQQIIDGAPLMSRVVVVGVCMQVDRFEPAMAIHKEIDLRFVFGQTPLEYRDTLHLIAEGKVDCAPMITGVVGLDGVAAAFDALADPETHAKILIDPRGDATIRPPSPRP
ncbi:zinc-binding dehydrogenase [uncultured Abyssibacter sp.]|uniref:zinc-binding dehydrogenase n=1 Tax=uncultured Abyssibacter sp. TaxID=2320202 RepID=UPI0032B167F7